MSEPALEIVGRDNELDILAEAVDAAAEGGCPLAVCGEPGIGKSVLIEAAARRGPGPLQPFDYPDQDEPSA